MKDDIFARKLRNLLKEKGISQRELARRTGITAATICRYCNGSKTPGSKAIIKIAEALDVGTDYLLGTDTKISSYSDAMTAVRTNAMKWTKEQKMRLIEALIYGNEGTE